MKKSIAVALLAISLVAYSTVSFGKSYVCYRYVDNDPTGSFVNIQASSQDEAEKKAMKKLKKLGGKVTGVNCKIKI